MNSDEFKGMWNQIKGQAKEQWGKLTDDELREVEGKKDKLVGKLQQKYGWSKEQAEKSVNEWSDQIHKVKK